MVINSLALASTIFLLRAYPGKVFGLNFDTVIHGKSLLVWGNIICVNVLAISGIRFSLFWIIQKYMPRMTLEHNESGLKVIQALSDIVDCLFLCYLGFVVMADFLHQKFLGLPIKNWIVVTIFIVIGWNIIALLTHLIVWSIRKLVSWYLNHGDDNNERLHRYLLLERLLSVHCLVYYGNGMKRSFNFMLSSLLLLLVWVFYFVPHLSQTDSKARTVRDFGTWTCTVLLILSFLWILKDCVLLSWEANAVYNRLSTEILEDRKSLFFLGMLGRHSHDILKIRYEVREKGGENNVESSTRNRAKIFMAKYLARVDAYYQDNTDEDDNEEMGQVIGGNRSQIKPKLSNKKRARVKQDLLLLRDDTMTLFDIQQVAQYFLIAGNSLLKETYASDILRKINSHSDIRCILEKPIIEKENVSDVVQDSSESVVLPPAPEDDPYFVVRLFKKCLSFFRGFYHFGDISEIEGVQNWENFKELLDLKSSSDDCHSEVKTWLVKSHNKCLFLANTLRSAKEVVDCLNNIISVLLISASLILWLILTGLTNTDILVLIASPFLAATFIFGDTCKSLFQGIIFVYVVHPFDVGDLCVIDGKMMEVKSIGVWKTTFSVVDKIGAHEDVIYPNTELTVKMVTKTDFDWNDLVEFSAEHLDKQLIEDLIQKIKDWLDDKKDESMPSSHRVAVLPAGNGVKIVVRFRHDEHKEGITYYECVEEKDKLRSKFISYVLTLANDVKEENKLPDNYQYVTLAMADRSMDPAYGKDQ